MNAAIPENYKNLSEIARSTGKELRSWINRKTGKDAIVKFNASHPDIENPVITIRGRGKEQGTWAHPELAAIFAAWCDPLFTAMVTEQNVQLKEQNALLKEKIRTFQVDTPAQIAARMDEVTEVRRMAHQVMDKGIEEVELIAKCHFAGAIRMHPKGLTFEQYLPHWLYSMNERTDIYPREVLEEMTIKAGKPIAYQGKILEHGYSHVWIEA
jgi:KilA-N domain